MQTGWVYLSNISPNWPIDRQRAILTGLGPEFIDDLSEPALKRKLAADLKERAVMLRPTSRSPGGCIYVAALPCLAIDGPDFLNVLAGAAGRQATIVDMETGLQIPPLPEAAQVAAALDAYRCGWERAKTQPARAIGTVKAAEKRLAEVATRIALIRDDWPKPTPTTRELLVRAGSKKGSPMAYNTAKLYLGKRPDKQTLYQAERKLAATRAAKKE